MLFTDPDSDLDSESAVDSETDAGDGEGKNGIVQYDDFLRIFGFDDRD